MVGQCRVPFGDLPKAVIAMHVVVQPSVTKVKTGAEVQIDCNFRAYVPKTKEQVSFSVNRTTDKHGVYMVEIPSVDGIECAEADIASTCQASLVGSSSASCNIPGYSSTTDEMAIKSRHPNLCIYSLAAMNFRPSKRNARLCGK
ncbi:hypothetical protein Goarm_019376 [Gossypium armourianum]|uniref:Uncharacterized protein n=1 Tax=Gossypium armourianum TaxID=34283 RepID=A0A7J9IKE7_9ROSI|nr:hypothetical protein [Gossypium armourianum]